MLGRAHGSLRSRSRLRRPGAHRCQPDGSGSGGLAPSRSWAGFAALEGVCEAPSVKGLEGWGASAGRFRFGLTPSPVSRFGSPSLVTLTARPPALPAGQQPAISHHSEVWDSAPEPSIVPEVLSLAYRAATRALRAPAWAWPWTLAETQLGAPLALGPVPTRRHAARTVAIVLPSCWPERAAGLFLPSRRARVDRHSLAPSCVAAPGTGTGHRDRAG